MSMKNVFAYFKKREGSEVQPSTGAVENPYLTARRTWNDHIGSVVSSRQMWAMLSILALLVALASVGGMAYIGSQSKFVPYVIEVDKLGQAVAVQVAERADPTAARVVHAQLAAFINDARMVTPDIALQKKAVYRVYALLSPNDAATTKMNEWFNGTPDSSPFKRAEKETVSVDIVSVIPQTPETWQIDWQETTRDRSGAVKGPPARMRALITVFIDPPTPKTTAEDIRSNPGGVFVRDFSWSKQV